MFSRGGPRPLDLESLLASVASEVPTQCAPAGLRVGHVHLHVSSIQRGLAFYRDVLGFDVWTLLPTAAFVSAGGYHHHLAFNTWRGEEIPRSPTTTVGLRSWTIELPTDAEVTAVRTRLRSAGAPLGRAGHGLITFDPWNICVRIVPATA